MQERPGRWPQTHLPLAEKGIDSIRFMYVSVGPLFAPTVSPYDANIQEGDLVKYDGALVVRGYGADAAWTFIAGEPSPDQERVNHALLAGHRAAVEMMGPGVIPKDVFNRAMEVVRTEGLPKYRHGHVGHSVGLDQTIEEPPPYALIILVTDRPGGEGPGIQGDEHCRCRGLSRSIASSAGIT